MLSYRHSFHAGNHADVFKHLVLTRVLTHLTAKDKPFSYLESHAGGGVYSLEGAEAQKTGEANQGIFKILDISQKDLAGSVGELVQPYLDLCRPLVNNQSLYPGSPHIASSLSRPEDSLTLMELHPTEIDVLKAHLVGDPRIHIHHREGFEGLKALTPPDPRRGLALLDPSYEVASDYRKAAQTVIQVARRWPVGILILWYPLVQRRAAELQEMRLMLKNAGLGATLWSELKVGLPQSKTTLEDLEREQGFGMEGSGLFVVNPPWKLEEEL